MTCIDRSKVFTPKNFPGSKSMPTSHNGQGSGKMSSAHGTTAGGPTKAMKHSAGRIGADCPGFSGTMKKGPRPISKKGY